MSGSFGKANIKAIVGIVILLLVMVFGLLSLDTIKTYMSGAAAGVEPVGVSVTAAGDSAVVSWTSEKPSMGVIEYGTSPASLLLRAPETDSTTSHKITLSPLRSGLSYYLRIRVGDEVFDNNGIPYSFKTKEGEVGGVENPVTIQPTQPISEPKTDSQGCNTGVDYNKDGVVNSFDVIYCRKNGGSGAAPTSGSTSDGKCKTSEDYDGNGVVNSFDMVKCLQNRGD